MSAAVWETVRGAVSTLLSELVEGSGPDAAWVLNQRDAGLLRSLRALSAAEASAPGPDGGASVAAHVDHVRYGLELLNRWSGGENPFASADWSASWRRGTVSEEEWAARLDALRAETDAWRAAVGRMETPPGPFEMTGVLASVVHLAYHLGAVRQIAPGARGPRDEG